MLLRKSNTTTNTVPAPLPQDPMVGQGPALPQEWSEDVALRRPLRVRWAGYEPGPNGTLAYKQEWRVIHPNEPGYELDYRMAVHALLAYGTPMPYAAEGPAPKRSLLGRAHAH